MITDKKGQFYVFAAVVLLVAVLTIVTNQPDIIIDEMEDFRIYLDNYAYDASIVMNNAIKEDLNITEALMNYTTGFLSYTDDKDLDIGIAFIYSYQGEIIIVNYLKEPVLISDGTSIGPEESHVREYSDTLTITYQEEEYEYSFSGSEDNELKAFFVRQDG